MCKWVSMSDPFWISQTKVNTLYSALSSLNLQNFYALDQKLTCPGSQTLTPGVSAHSTYHQRSKEPLEKSDLRTAYLRYAHDDLHPVVHEAFACFKPAAEDFSFAGLLKCPGDVSGCLIHFNTVVIPGFIWSINQADPGWHDDGGHWIDPNMSAV